MSGTDGTEDGPVAEWTRRSGRPPVPAPVPSEPDGADGQHRTERVPFPLPPLQGERPAAPRTEQLPAQSAPGGAGRQPGGYPPRVPGAPRQRPVDERPDEDDDSAR